MTPPSAADSLVRRNLVPLALLLPVFAAPFAWVRPVNFGGADEWLVLDAGARGLLGLPTHNRPLTFLFSALTAAVWPHSLRAYWVAEGLHLFLAGALLFLILRRLCPGEPHLAFLAAAFCLTWAPLDFLRLDTVLLTGYTGFAFGTLLALFLFVESWVRRSPVLLAAGLLVGATMARGVEAVLPLLAGAPLLIAGRIDGRRARFAVWSAAWAAMLAVVTALILVPTLGRAASYQTAALHLDLSPSGIAERLLRQFRFHLLPLVTSDPRELVGVAAPLAALTFVAAWAAARRALGSPAPAPARPIARLALAGLVAAGLGYAAISLTPSITTAARAQVLAAPGIGLFLAASLSLLGARVPPSARPAVVALAGAWVVAVGAGRTVAMQREWDAWRSLYPKQHDALVQLVALAPGFEKPTLVILRDEAGAFPYAFTFRHALELLYGGQAKGQVWPGDEYLYYGRFVPTGFLSTPWPAIASAWREPPRLFAFDQIAVFRLSAAGGLRLEEDWPTDWPPAAGYRPRARLVAGLPSEVARGLLAIPPPTSGAGTAGHGQERRPEGEARPADEPTLEPE